MSTNNSDTIVIEAGRTVKLYHYLNGRGIGNVTEILDTPDKSLVMKFGESKRLFWDFCSSISAVPNVYLQPGERRVFTDSGDVEGIIVELESRRTDNYDDKDLSLKSTLCGYLREVMQFIGHDCGLAVQVTRRSDD